MAQEYRFRLVEAVTHGRVLVRAAANGAGVLAGFHGYAETADVQLQRLESIPGAGRWTLVAIQGLNRFYRGRTEEVVAGWMTRQDRETAIRDNIAYVTRAIEEVSPEGPLPRLVYAGFSQGTAMAFRAAVTGRLAAHAVVAVGGDIPPELLADPRSAFPPVLLARGNRDDWYTQAKLDADVAALTSRGVSVTPLVVSGGHEWTSPISEAIADFLRSLDLPTSQPP